MSAKPGRMATLGNAAEFKRVFRNGRTARTSDLVIHALDRRDDQPGRYGLVVSKKVGGAVERNRAKRRVRAAINGVGGIPRGLDVVIVVREGRRPSVEKAIRDIAEVLHQWPRRASR